MDPKFRRLIRRKRLVLLSLILFVLLLIPLSLSLGTYRASPLDVLRVLLRPDGSPLSTVIWDLRLRRILAALLIGAVLGSSGAAVQASMRNPLASPFTFGLSFAASLGVAVALLFMHGGNVSRFTISVYNPFLVSASAFSFSLLQVALILLLARRAGLDTRAVILSAIAISFLYQALLYLLQYFVLNEVLVSTVIFWTFGDLGRVSWTELWFLSLPSLLLVLPYFLYRSLDYDLLTSGDELTRSSGVSPERIRLETCIVAALGTALATSFAGVIGFVCLVAPHACRLLLGGGHRYLMPASMVMGALILLLSDTVGRTILSPTIIPVGIMTSLVGAPLLVYLLMRGGRLGGGY
ncbi:MAG: iron ABC transporter permease [Candidatus Hadarchaeales archaeon]